MNPNTNPTANAIVESIKKLKKIFFILVFAGCLNSLYGQNYTIFKIYSYSNGVPYLAATITNGTFNAVHTGDGSGLTNLNASQLTSGTVPLAAIPVAGLGNSITITATNRLVFTSVSSLTNTLGREATAIVTAGTSVALQDTNGVAIATIGTVATLDVLIPMHVNMRLAGTGVSAILY